MNRPIKFRVWDKALKQFVGRDIGGYVINGVDIELNAIFNNPNYVFQQYTGIKDLNGREIYEGDELKIWMGGTQQHKTYIVRDIREFYYECSTFDSYMRITKAEIVGNFFEGKKNE
jgi:hypothetical protein